MSERPVVSCVRSRLSVAHPRSMSQSSLRAPHLAAVHMTRPFQIDRSMHCRNSRRRCDDDVAHRPSRSTSILPRLPCQSWCISEAMSTKTTALRPLPESIIDIETFDSAKIAIKDCGPGIGRRVDVANIMILSVIDSQENMYKKASGIVVFSRSSGNQPLVSETRLFFWNTKFCLFG